MSTPQRPRPRARLALASAAALACLVLMAAFAPAAAADPPVEPHVLLYSELDYAVLLTYEVSRDGITVHVCFEFHDEDHGLDIVKPGPTLFIPFVGSPVDKPLVPALPAPLDGYGQGTQEVGTHSRCPAIIVT